MKLTKDKKLLQKRLKGLKGKKEDLEETIDSAEFALWGIELLIKKVSSKVAKSK